MLDQLCMCRSFRLLTQFFFFSSRRRHTRCSRDWSSDVCSSDLMIRDVAVTGVQTCALPILEPRAVLRVLLRDAGDQPLDAGGFGPPELRLLAVDVVHDLRDEAERRIAEAEARDERLEGAGFPLVGVLGLEHVEPELARPRPVAVGGDELELRRGVDEPANQPRARDPIDVDPLPGHPRGAARSLGGIGRYWDLSVRLEEYRL